jgi:hypothetical protein
MFLIKIDKNIKLEEVQSIYQQLNSHIKADVIVDLLLPKSLENNYIGLLPALYQYIITWMRYPKSGKLLLDVDNPDLTDFEELYENELLFPAVSLLWNKNEVFNKTGEINLRGYLRPFNIKFFDKMKSVVALKGWKLLLTNFDHLSEDRGILPCFELNGTFIANESKLSNSLESGIKTVLGYSSDAEKTYHQVKKHLIGISYELMKNTFEWGKDDEDRVPLDPSVRGLLIRFYKKNRTKLIEEFQSHKGLSDYFKSKVLKENAKSELYFLEIDVFDSGVGFVKKYKSLNPLDKELTDFDIVKKCMIKHNTSAKGLEKDDKGIGLDRILTILDKKGFLRITTGKVCLYRNLISHPYKKLSKDSIAEMELFDWKKNSNNNYTSFYETEGSVVTIIYPLSFDITNA